MPSLPQRLGTAGEDIAATFLIGKGYEILDRHVSTRGGEIDIVARDGNELVFVEVKMRRSDTFGGPEEAVTDQKLDRIQSAIDAYLSRFPGGTVYRFDCVFISRIRGHQEITHVESCG